MLVPASPPLDSICTGCTTWRRAAHLVLHLFQQERTANVAWRFIADWLRQANRSAVYVLADDRLATRQEFREGLKLLKDPTRGSAAADRAAADGLHAARGGATGGCAGHHALALSSGTFLLFVSAPWRALMPKQIILLREVYAHAAVFTRSAVSSPLLAFITTRLTTDRSFGRRCSDSTRLPSCCGCDICKECHYPYLRRLYLLRACILSLANGVPSPPRRPAAFVRCVETVLRRVAEALLLFSSLLVSTFATGQVEARRAASLLRSVAAAALSQLLPHVASHWSCADLCGLRRDVQSSVDAATQQCLSAPTAASFAPPAASDLMHGSKEREASSIDALRQACTLHRAPRLSTSTFIHELTQVTFFSPVWSKLSVCLKSPLMLRGDSRG